MKSLIEPMLLIEVGLVIATTSIWAAAVRTRAAPLVRRTLWALTAIVFLLVVFSLPIVGDALQHALEVPRTQLDVEPEFVVVLSGGYARGETAEMDVLSMTTAERVAAGVSSWKRHPAARLVLTGAVPKADRSNGHLADLMSELAVSRGVPSAMIVREPTALTTRDHAPALLRLGIKRDAPMIIVTSANHMRRAAVEFRRYFTHIAREPVTATDSSHGWRAWWPSSVALWNSSDALQEAVAVVWYRVRR